MNAVSEEARIAYGSGEPRSSGYWTLWSSCGENNKADTAAANGGREAGWIILDDLLEQPGITLGAHTVTTCEEGVAVLDGSSTDLLGSLAKQLFTAELNLKAGSQYCGAVDETTAVANTILTTFEYQGPDTNEPFLTLEQIASLEAVKGLLAFYNAGSLCR